jgi:hypothetical protein
VRFDPVALDVRAVLGRRPLARRFAGDRFVAFVDAPRPVRALRRVLRLLMLHLLGTAISGNLAFGMVSRMRSLRARRAVAD